MPSAAGERCAGYNQAFDEYGGDEPRAFRIGWAAVKRQYEKIDGAWVEKP